MPIKTSQSEGPKRERFLIPEGNHPARLVLVADLGVQEGYVFKGEKTPDRHKVWLSWEILDPDIRIEKEDGESKAPWIGDEYTLSQDDRSKLYGILKPWIGEPGEDGWDLGALVGEPCLLTVSHNTKGENTYANVGGATKLPKKMIVPPLEGDSIVYDPSETNACDVYDLLPEFIQKKVDAQIGGRQDISIPF